MSWCCCCKPEDEAIKLWKDNTKYVIKLVEKIQNLGKKCILNRQVNREDSIDVNEILKCFRKLDRGVHNVKLEAVQFLAPNFELIRERNCQINHYKENAEKRIQILYNGIQMLKERYAESNVGEEDNHEPCSSQAIYNQFQGRDELIENVPKEQLFARKAFLKQDSLLGDLKILLVKYHENVKTLEDEINTMQKEAPDQPEENTEDEPEHGNSEYESDEEIQVNKSEYAVQYSVENRKRYSQEYIDDYGSQVHSSNETLTFFNREFVEQGWPIFQDCIGCLWSNYCASSDQQSYLETSNRTRNRSRNVQKEMEEEYNPDKVKSRSGSINRSRHKPNVMEEDISNQSNTQDGIVKKNKKRSKSRSSVKPKQLKTNNKSGKTKKEKNKERANKNRGAKNSKNVNKTKNKT